MPVAPTPFLEARVHDVSTIPGLTCLCAGFESQEWRFNQLAAHIIEWLPEFALTQKDIDSLGPHNLVRLLGRAAKAIYNTRTAAAAKVEKGAEIGELLLHIAVRQVFNSEPAISKYYYKDSANDQVKGFDAVHVVTVGTDLELWLGEVKFYKDVDDAIRAVIKEIHDHLDRDYLRGEFAFILNKLDSSWPHAATLQKLLDPNTSLDSIFKQVTIPVFLSYESSLLISHSEIIHAFLTEIQQEARSIYSSFCSKGLPTKVKLHLFLFPMRLKKKLVEAFDRRLEACQQLTS